jgi:glycolate oxidase FAD binding subunit
LIESEGQQSWKRLSDLALYIPHNLRLKISVLPSKFLQIVKLIERTFSELTEELEITSYIGNGVIRLFAQTKENLEISLYKQATETLRDFCHKEGGSVVLELAPLKLKQQVDVWGIIGSQIDLMKAIKNRLDPNSILSPGRFLTGL